LHKVLYWQPFPNKLSPLLAWAAPRNGIETDQANANKKRECGEDSKWNDEFFSVRLQLP
jgi:hypothetical protein